VKSLGQGGKKKNTRTRIEPILKKKKKVSAWWANAGIRSCRWQGTWKEKVKGLKKIIGAASVEQVKVRASKG